MAKSTPETRKERFEKRTNRELTIGLLVIVASLLLYNGCWH